METRNHASVITSWGVVSSQGIGKKTFANNITSHSEPTRFQIKSYNVADYVGRKGTRYYDRLTQFAVGATYETLHDAGGHEIKGEEAGFILGTTFGSLNSNCDFMKEVLKEKPNRIDGSAFPSTVMNYAAGQVAIRFGLKGLNATLSGGRLASIHALQYADRSIKSGKSQQLFVGAVEEWNEYLEWGFKQVSPDLIGLGEGSVVVLLETLSSAEANKRNPLAILAGCSTRMLPYRFSRSIAQEFADGLANCIRTVIDREKVNLSDSDVLVLFSTDKNEEMRSVEEKAVRSVWGSLPAGFNIKERLGECYSVMGMFQLAAFLAMIENGRHQLPKYALLLSVEQNGMMGCALIERWEA